MDLNNPSENIKKVQRQSKWEIGVVQWNPHHFRKNVFVSAVSIDIKKRCYKMEYETYTFRGIIIQPSKYSVAV